MHRQKRWKIGGTIGPAADELAGKLKVSRIVAQILLNRGFTDPAACLEFLQPSLKCLHDPAGIPGLSKAADRIAAAIRDQQKIVIYGDYDVDGITATAILWHAIRVLGGTADYYIPHRIEEGYGLNADAIGQLCDEGAKLIVTVDCGVTAVEPARVAKDRGADLIVTDHHEWKDDFPECHAIVHPRLPCDGPAYANPNLCGAGVAFKLAWGIGMAISGAARVNDAFRAFLLDATALAALGTIADVVPLVGENRILAHFGLGGLMKTRLTGIRALIDSAGLGEKKLDSYDVGFMLAPRLNACGRMGHARLAVEMLTRADAAKANEIAAYLESQNRERQAMERRILEQAESMIAEGKLADDEHHAIVVGREDWHAGVIGIVASRIVDRYHRPAVVVALSNGHGAGSGRSISGFHLASALQACTQHLESHGGHEMAAGLKIATENFPAFQAAFRDHAKAVIGPEQLVAELNLDTEADLRDITPALVTDLARLGPFGQANRRPILCVRGVTIASPPRRCGKTGAHLQLTIRQGETVMRCIAFGLAEMGSKLSAGTLVDLAVEPSINEFNGNRNVELQVRDFAVS